MGTQGTQRYICTLMYIVPNGGKKRRIGYTKVHTPLGGVPMYPCVRGNFILDSGTEVRALTSVPGLELDR